MKSVIIIIIIIIDRQYKYFEILNLKTVSELLDEMNFSDLTKNRCH